MKTEISVIICTHNPRMDYLERVLGAFDVAGEGAEEFVVFQFRG